MNTSSRDAGIPVLTEIIEPPSGEIAGPEAPAVVLPPPEPPSIEAMEAHAAATWSDEEWNRLERKIRERILRQILGRIDTLLEQRVRDTLADVLQTAVEKLANDIKGGLHQSLEDIVSRAIAQEITRLQIPKK
ncbi:MAG: hypothetical protein JWQ23_1054 [Herminiimonas sp.]|nr:hypothetical protein [Herminiimonas sp.]